MVSRTAMDNMRARAKSANADPVVARQATATTDGVLFETRSADGTRATTTRYNPREAASSIECSESNEIQREGVSQIRRVSAPIRTATITKNREEIGGYNMNTRRVVSGGVSNQRVVRPAGATVASRTEGVIQEVPSRTIGARTTGTRDTQTTTTRRVSERATNTIDKYFVNNGANNVADDKVAKLQDSFRRCIKGIAMSYDDMTAQEQNDLRAFLQEIQLEAEFNRVLDTIPVREPRSRQEELDYAQVANDIPASLDEIAVIMNDVTKTPDDTYTKYDEFVNIWNQDRTNRMSKEVIDMYLDLIKMTVEDGSIRPQTSVRETPVTSVLAEVALKVQANKQVQRVASSRRTTSSYEPRRRTVNNDYNYAETSTVSRVTPRRTTTRSYDDYYDQPTGTEVYRPVNSRETTTRVVNRENTTRVINNRGARSVNRYENDTAGTRVVSRQVGTREVARQSVTRSNGGVYRDNVGSRAAVSSTPTRRAETRVMPDAVENNMSFQQKLAKRLGRN